MTSFNDKISFPPIFLFKNGIITLNFAGEKSEFFIFTEYGRQKHGSPK